jgi:sporulation protein YtfJ
MAEHPIQGLMKTAMETLKTMVDVNTVVGDPVETQDGTVIVPVSRVAFGFAAGGGEYGPGAADTEGEAVGFPFGGGSGAGVSVAPVGFLVVQSGSVRILPVDGATPVDRLIDLVPQVVEKIRGREAAAPPVQVVTAGPVPGTPTAAGTI